MDKMAQDRFEKIETAVSKCNIMVIGDIMLDEYQWGDVTRISPEAPVPVLNVEKTSTRLGGAANVVQNLKHLGVNPILISVCGKDSDGKRLCKIIKDMDCPTNGIYQSTDRPTTIKTRIMAKQQQIVRVDKEQSNDLTSKESTELLKLFEKNLKNVQGVIISDYGKGVVSKPFIKKVVADCKKNNVFVAVDPKEKHFDLYKGVNVITPNLKEAHAALGMVSGHKTIDQIKEMGWNITKKLDLAYLLITLSERGMALFENEEDKLIQLPTMARTVYDVTGAGDTVISVFTTACTCGATPEEAAFMANHAAGITIAELGTASVNMETLRKACL